MKKLFFPLVLIVALIIGAYYLGGLQPVTLQSGKAETSQQTSVKTAPPESAEPKKQTDQGAQNLSLNAFNQNVNIKLIQRGTATENNQPIAVLVYEVENRGQKSIQTLSWASAFAVNNQVFFVQDMKVELKEAIAAGKKEQVTISLFLDKLPANAKQVLESKETPINHITIARQIDFTDGSHIIVKD